MKIRNLATRIVFLLNLVCLTSVCFASDSSIGILPESALMISTELKMDERLHVLPSYVKAEEKNQKSTKLTVWIYEPELDSSTRKMTLEAVAAKMGFDAKDLSNGLFFKRAFPFLTDNERGKTVQIVQGGKTIASGVTAANGKVEIPVKFDYMEPEKKKAADLVSFIPIYWHRNKSSISQIVTDLPIIAKNGLSVISDLDDTIKISNVLNRDELLRNTFIRPYQDVKGMAKYYQKLFRQGVSFHYVSASPWALYEPLQSFLNDSGFPRGSLSLRELRFKDSSVFEFFKGSREYKLAKIKEILSDFPKRTFILIGDSGENDPEIYAEIARLNPQQVKKIYIREVFAVGAEPKNRYKATFSGLEPDRWQVFREANELRP